MPDNLSDIVQITITKETTAIDTASFNIPLILTTSAAFPERTRTYTSIGAVAEDFGDESEVYTVASKMLGGNIRPTYIVVGRRSVNSASFVVSNVSEGDTYTVTINGSPYSYVAEDGDSDADIAAGIVAIYSDEAQDGVTVTSSADSITVEGDNIYVAASGNIQEQTLTSDEGWGEAITAIEGENSVWYGVVATTHEPEEVLEIAQAIQARRKIFGTSTQDPVALTAEDTDIGSLLSEYNYDRTYWVYSPFADEDFPEAAWMGGQMLMTPGSNTWAYKSASGVRVANISDTQKTNIQNKNGNTFTRRAGVEIFEDGIMASGEYIDIVIGIDWWYARIQEAIFFRLVNSRKIPMTRAGASTIQAEIMSVNSLGVSNGLIADDSPITVIAPDPLRLSPNMRAQRTLGDFVVRFRLAGAVHKVRVDATISV